MVVAAYIEQLTTMLAPASVKQHLAALQTLDQCQVGAQIVVENRHTFDDSAWQRALSAPPPSSA